MCTEIYMNFPTLTQKMNGVDPAGPVHNYNPDGVPQATGLVSVKPNAACEHHSKKAQRSITALS